MDIVEVQVYSDFHKQGVIQLILDIQQQEFNIPINLEAQPDLNSIKDFYQTNKGNFWVATGNGMLVGTIAMLDIGNSRAALRKMFVHEQYRGNIYGVGQKLLSSLFSWARAKDFTEIFLGTTAAFKAAQRFYEKNGFREIKKEILPEEFPVMDVDSKFYKYII